MSIKNAVLAVVSIVRGVPGIHEAPDYPPEQMSDFPFVVVYPGNGVHSIGALSNGIGEKKYLGEIIVELHVGRKDLASSVAYALDFADTIPEAILRNPTLLGTCDTIANISQSFGELGWGDTPTIGFRFVIEGVKIRTNL